jgi:hypothetical protein
MPRNTIEGGVRPLESQILQKPEKTILGDLHDKKVIRVTANKGRPIPSELKPFKVTGLEKTTGSSLITKALEPDPPPTAPMSCTGCGK